MLYAGPRINVRFVGHSQDAIYWHLGGRAFTVTTLPPKPLQKRASVQSTVYAWYTRTSSMTSRKKNNFGGGRVHVETSVTRTRQTIYTLDTRNNARRTIYLPSKTPQQWLVQNTCDAISLALNENVHLHSQTGRDLFVAYSFIIAHA